MAIHRHQYLSRTARLKDNRHRIAAWLQVDVHGAVDRGLLVSLSAIRGFVPVSQVPRPDREYPTAEQLRVRPAPVALT